MKNVVKVRIYRTVEQKASLSKAFGCARWFWNNSLNATNELYKETAKGRAQRDEHSFALSQQGIGVVG
jgi:putative transposase